MMNRAGKFLHAASDVAWLREGHLDGVHTLPKFQSFILYGNEDFPDRIDLFTKKNPRFDDPPVMVLLTGQDDDGEMIIYPANLPRIKYP